MKPGRRAWLALGFLLLTALPAYANNPPAPDGLFSLLMIFVAAILGRRLAGATFPKERRAWKVIKRLGLGLAFLLTLGGTEMALPPLLVLLFYGLRQGAYVMKLGQGSKRFVFGGAVLFVTLLGLADYGASSADYPGEAMRRESSAVRGLRQIVVAERQFLADARLDVDKNGVPEYGSLDQLRQAGLLEDWDVARGPYRGYRYTVVLAGDPRRDEKEFFVFASPTHYGREGTAWFLVPGYSLVKGLRLAPPLAVRTFASDETGVIRGADLGGSRAVTHEEAQRWPPLN